MKKGQGQIGLMKALFNIGFEYAGKMPKLNELQKLNRDSTKLMAERFDKVKRDQQQFGNFIFVSACPSILPTSMPTRGQVVFS